MKNKYMSIIKLKHNKNYNIINYGQKDIYVK